MDKQSIPTFKVCRWWRSLEAFLEIIARIFGLIIVYLVFQYIGIKLVGDDFQTDILLSLVVLPSIYVLKDSHRILEAFFVTIEPAKGSITVNSGILTQRRDKLGFDSVENVERVRSIVGRWKGYSTYYLYAYGSWVRVPFVRDSLELEHWLESRITKQDKLLIKQEPALENYE